MKKQAALLLFLYPLLSLSAQVPFTQLTDSPATNTPSDSRSCNFVDVNGDGWDDIFISNGPSSGQNNLLYLNNGDGSFSAAGGGDITNDNSSSDGATFADVDNDGDLDAYVVTWYGQPNYFYLNDGNGQFVLQTVPGSSGTYSETASWGDYDNDGLVDLYVTNSTDFTTNAPAVKRNLLYRNAGGGQLQPITTGAWVTDAHISRSVQWTDFDKDGDLDLFVANEEGQRNDLYRNEGEAGFVAVADNAILSPPHRSSTGSSWGDVDNDGDLDLFVANYANQHNQLFLNDGSGSFVPVMEGDIVSDGGYSFGSSFADMDNDGDLDLFVANGFGPISGVENFLYINQGDGTFKRDKTSIPNLSTKCSFGCAWGDIDNDGFLDLVVANCNRNNQPQNSNSLFHNEGNSNHWLKIKLEGSISNRQGIGARVMVKANVNGQPVWQLREVSAQDGYNCQNSLQVHFGLGDADRVDSLAIDWPSGVQSLLVDLPADTVYTAEESAFTSSPGWTSPENRVQLIPNPVQDVVQIHFYNDPPSNFAWMAVIDLQGRPLLRKKISGFTGPTAQASIPIEGLPTGIYLLHFSTDRGWGEALRFIKK